LETNWNTIPAVLSLTGGGIKNLIENLQLKMKPEKTKPVTRELIEVDLDFSNHLISKSKELKRAEIRLINNQVIEDH
jgi:hypothetical protein